MAKKMSEPVYTTREVGRFCGVVVTTVMAWVNQGKLKADRTPGGHRRIYHRDLLEFFHRYGMRIPAELRRPELRRFERRRILIVDDDPAIIRLLIRLIGRLKENIEVETAVDGFEAGQKVEGFHPEIVILDLMLPGVDGFRICKNIRASRQTRGIKILAITGYTAPDYKKRIMECGADYFLAKPFDVKIASERILAMLAIRPEERVGLHV